MEPKKKRADANRGQPQNTVVGIGASAGGLKALQRLFNELPDDTGYAFAIVIHLKADTESHYAEVLQPSTPMPVTQIQQEVPLKANHVYVIPPDYYLQTTGSHLRPVKPTESDKVRTPIDHFFRSLALSHKENAIGILLSGTGSDGVLGLRELKSTGGIVLVQDPQEAEFDGMPQAAINQNIHDKILKTGEMVRELTKLKETLPNIKLPHVNNFTKDEADVYQKILDIVQRFSSSDFSRYKSSTVLRRVRRRMQLCQVQRMEEYLEILTKDEKEPEILFEDFLISVTEFFRDTSVFESLERSIIPELFENKKEDDTIRVWVAGCSSGEEAYTIAILLKEYQEKLKHPPYIQIFASDIHDKLLIKARKGIYPESIAGAVGQKRLHRFFKSQPDSYQVKQEIRDMIVFSSHSILRDPPFSRMDLISCRNLFIYLQRAIQKEVFNIFHYSLVPKGYLLLGTAEAVDASQGFRSVDKKSNIFIRDSEKLALPNLPLSRADRFYADWPEPQRQNQIESSHGSHHQKIIEMFGPPSILVNKSDEIVHFSNKAGRYLVQPGGNPTNNIYKRVHPEIRIGLRSAMFKVHDVNEVTIPPITVTIEKEKENVSVRICKANHADLEGYFLILFENVDTPRPFAQTMESGNPTEREKQLETELEETKERLQFIIEQYETSQEEMRSSNEELQSTNEELRSALEEVETGKEELQSVNEELLTVNQENRNKVEELSNLTSDLNNYLSSTDIATIFLDKSLKIIQFTPLAGSLFNIRQTDCGRILTELNYQFEYNHLKEDALDVLRSLERKEIEVAGKNGDWYLLHMLPYRTVNDHIEGVVLNLVEISRVKKAEQEAHEKTEKYADLVTNLEKRVKKRTEDIRILASKLTLAEQHERERLSTLLHDNVQQLLSSARMQIHILNQEGHLTDEQEGKLDFILEEAITITRQLAVDLNPPVLNNEGLQESLEWLKTQMKLLHDLDVDVKITSAVKTKRRDLQFLIFQLVRELLFNSVKHSGAKSASVSVVEVKDFLHIAVRDEGKGFDVNNWRKNKGSSSTGLQNTMNRLDVVGGTLKIESQPGKGTTIVLDIPNLS